MRARMVERLRPRPHALRRWSTPVLAVLLVGSVATAALQRDGFRATRVDLNDAGIWVTSRTHGALGRVNTQIEAIEVRTAMSDLADVVQVDDTVVMVDTKASQMIRVDVALARADVNAAQKVPQGAQVLLGGDAGAVVDRASGKAWLVPRDQLAGLDPAKAPVTLKAGKGVIGALGTDGTLHVFNPETKVLHEVGLGGAVRTQTVSGSFEKPQITAVGSRAVLLDEASGRLVVPGGGDAKVPVGDEPPRLQVPGEPAGDVLVATADSLLSVDLGGGSPRTLDDSGTGEPVDPVRLQGCSYGAWSASPRYSVQCDDDRKDRSAKVPGTSSGAELTFRVNRNRILINDRATGANLLFGEDEPKPILDWTNAQDDDEREDEEQQTEQLDQKKLDCGTSLQAPEAVDDEAGTRPGRPVVVPVLDNDKGDRCDVLALEEPPALDPKIGTVSVVGNGASLQVTPNVAYTGTVAVDYTVRGQGGKDTARLTVSITPDGQNGAPVAVADKTVVESGRSVSHDVLLNDRDPDGDPLTLVQVTAEEGSVQFDADGLVRYTSAGGSVGTKRLRYQVQDPLGGEAEGTLDVTVQPAKLNLLPTARNDRLVAFVGKAATVDLLANDTDPNDDRLTVTKVEAPESLGATWDPEGELRLTPTTAGTFQFGYEITDDTETVQARVRVDVLPDGGNTLPIAVRDDLVVRPNTPTLVDLVRNDIDLDGDLLAITKVETIPNSALAVEVLEMRVVRVTASASLTAPEIVRYWISDGGSAVEGVLVVRPYLVAGLDQAPLVKADEVTVRAGGVVAVPVLRNDRDPEGERLTLAAVKELPAGQGTAFIQGDELRYQAPTEAGTYRTTYSVADPGLNTSDGEVVFRVIPLDAANRPPRGPTLEARVVSGGEITVRVLLLGADPDGDAVAIVGIADAPGKGQASIAADAITYTSDRGASGRDTFTFTLRDSGGLGATGRVRVVITPKADVNSAPVGVPDRLTLGAGEERVVAVLANDVDADGDALSLLTDDLDKPTAPQLGKIRVDGQRILYTAPGSLDVPPGSTSVQTSFSYGVTDGRGGSSRGLVTVTLQSKPPENVAPLARDDFAPAQIRGATVTIPVLANDTDPDDPDGTLKVTVPPGSGATVGSDGTVTVTAKTTSVALVYTITDAAGATAQAVLQVPVFETLPPITAPDVLTVKAGGSGSVDVLKNDRDPAKRTLKLLKLTGVRGGAAKITDDAGTVQFTAEKVVKGDAGFNYQVSNGTDVSVGSVTVTVEGQNFPPEFQGTDAQVAAGGTRDVDLASLVTDLNPDDEFTFEGATSSNPKVRAALQGSKLTLSADDDAKGQTATVSLTVGDGTAEVPGTVTVTVTGNEGPPPVAVPDTAETTQGVAIDVNVTANDVDPLGDGLTVRVLNSQGGTGTVSGTTGIRFVPSPTFFGTALVNYEILDSSKEQDRASQATLRVTVIGRPSAPGAPSGVVDNKKVRLTWGVPANNGAPITGYKVQTDVGTITQSASSNSLEFTGLQNGTTYRFRVAAINKAVKGDGELVWSAYSGGLKPDTLPSVPGAPTPRYGDGQITVTWAAPANEGTPISKYDVRISPAPSGGASVSLPGTARSHTFTGLQNGQAYSFSLRATNEAGDTEFGPSSSTGDTNAVPAGKPRPATGVVAERVDTDPATGGLVRVSWTFDGSPTSSQANGDAPTGFTIQPNGSPGHAPVSVNGAARSVEISGLGNGSSYTFTVKATNKAGTDPTGGTSNPATPASAPSNAGPPEAVAGDQRATLTFNPPDDGGAPITRYIVLANGSEKPNTINSGGGSLTVTDLANGTPYSFQTRACNEVGCGPTSPGSSSTVTPHGPPFAPAVSANVNSQIIRWTWSTPDGNGSPVASYQLTLDGVGVTANCGANCFERAFGFSQSHTLVVRAVNQAGDVGSPGQATGQTAPAPQTVTIAKGGSAQGVSTPGQGTCNSSSCRYVTVTLSGFSAGSHAVACNGSAPGTNPYWQYNANNNTTTAVCYYGYPNTQMWVVVDGTYVSNYIDW